MSVLAEGSQTTARGKNEDVFSDPEEEDDDLRAKIFPQRLMEILSNERNTDAITWLPHGRAFIIRNRKLFAEKIMPKFFSRKSKYSSFIRKLNRWNFIRISSGPELGAYHHEFFLRDKPHLAAQMFCKNARAKLAMATVAESQGTTQEKPSSPIGFAHLTPNFVAHQRLPQQGASSLNMLALQKLAFEEQLGKEQANKKHMVKYKLLEHTSLSQHQSPVDHSKRFMLEAMIAGGGCTPMIQQSTTPHVLQGQLVLQQQQSQAARLIQMQEIMALRQRQGSAAMSSIFNHAFVT